LALRSPDTVQLSLGGSLTSNVTGKSEQVTSDRGRPYTIRWRVSQGLNGNFVRIQNDPLEQAALRSVRGAWPGHVSWESAGRGFGGRRHARRAALAAPRADYQLLRRRREPRADGTGHCRSH
jgi:hypothetical protein